MDWTSERVAAHEVRLFPSVRINSDREAELRATCALCSVLRAVSEFGRKVVKASGGPAGRLSCFTEISFDPLELNGKALRPDAAIRVVRGKTEWVALVETKVGDNCLTPEQIGAYQALARREGFNAVISVSNQVADSSGLPPIPLDGRRLRSTPVIHFSWDRLLSEAQVLGKKSGIADEDQRWMLDEWTRYVADPSSRIIAPADLGDQWHAVLKSAKEGLLGSVQKPLEHTVQRWDAFLQKLSLRLRAKLGVEVSRKLARAEKSDSTLRLRRIFADAVNTGILSGELSVPDAAGDICLAVDLPARATRFSMSVEAPSQGRTQTRIRWLLRQLNHDRVPQNLIVRVLWSQRQLESHARLGHALNDEQKLFVSNRREQVPPDAVPRRFALEWTTNLVRGRGKSTTQVVDGITADFESYYRGVVESVTKFTPSAPRLPKKAPQDRGSRESKPQHATDERTARPDESQSAPSEAEADRPSQPDAVNPHDHGLTDSPPEPRRTSKTREPDDPEPGPPTPPSTL